MKNSGTSPFKASIGGYRPSSGIEGDYAVTVHHLQKENSSLNEEIAILRSKSKRLVELEEKVDMILKHNNQLLT